jgi:hypothetical protein
MTLAPSQQGYIAGCGVNLPTGFQCGTSTDGSVVGIPNPLTPTVNTTSGSGSLPAGVYYTVYEWYDAAGHVTLASPETRLTLSVTESLVVNPPSSGIPANATGMDVFIGVTSGGETLQGQTVGNASFVQSTALSSGASPSSTNTTLCQVTANDSVWPVGTGYNVSLVDSNGNPVPQYPMQWQLLGAGTTYNLSNGLPYYHGVVFYPVPILAQPANHGTQSISGSLSLGGYNLLNAGKVGVGTATPGWPLDVENGLANFESGLLLGGVAPSGQECAGSTDNTAIDAYIPCLTAATAFYQTVAAAGVAKTQRAVLNFLAPLTVTDSSSPAETNVGLQTVGSGAYVPMTAALGTATHCVNWTAAGLGDSGSACPSSTPTQTNCLTTACAGGSTYSGSGGTYTNGSGGTVFEEVTAQLTGTSGTGGQYELNTTVGGVIGPSNQIANICNSSPPTSVGFFVAPGASFTVTPSVISGCSPAGTWAVTSWLEFKL